MWQHNVYYVCVMFSVVSYVGLHDLVQMSIRNCLYMLPHTVVMSPNFKNFKLSDFLKFSDFNEVPTNSLMMIY